MIGEQLQIDRTPARRPAVRLDSVKQLHAQLAIGWSSAMRAAGPSGERAAAARAAGSAVSQICACPEELVALSHRMGAAPIPMRWEGGVAEPLPCVVSIAHSGGRAVAAAAMDRRIGVDLERTGAVADSELRMFATRSERAFGIEPTLLWTLKEAAWKAFSCSPQTPFSALSVAAFATSLASPTYVVFGLHDDFIPASAYTWQPWPGWLATLVEVA